MAERKEKASINEYPFNKKIQIEISSPADDERSPPSQVRRPPYAR